MRDGMVAARRMGAADWAMLVTLSVLWGGSFLFVGVAVRELPALSIVAVRVAVAALALYAVMRVLRIRWPRVPGLGAAFLGMGLLNNAIPFSLLVWGQHHLASGLAAILNATTPLFTVLVAHALTHDERLTPAKVVGAATGFAGVVVMLGTDRLAGPGGMLAAQAACLAAALAYAFAGIYGRRFRRMGVPPLASAAGQVSASTLMMLPLALLVDRPWALPMPGPATLLALLGLGLLSTALAYLLYFRILASAGATNLLLVTTLIPVSAVLLGWLLLGEQLGPQHLAGMALIGAGFAVIDGRLLPRRSGARPGVAPR